MPPTKLTDSDKQKILALYRQSDETTTSLAQQFSVSTSTISRILKQSLSEAEYDRLIQKKRAAGSSKSESEETVALPASGEQDSGEQDSVEPDPQPPQPDVFSAAPQADEPEAADLEAADSDSAAGKERRQRRRSASAIPEISKPSAVAPPKLAKKKQVDAEDEAIAPVEPAFSAGVAADDEDAAEPVAAELEAVERDILKHEGVFTDIDEDDEDLDDDELTDDLDDDLDDDGLDDDDDDGSLIDAAVELDDLTGGLHSNMPLHIAPLSEARLPKSCYLVVDRTSDLVTRPLKDFAGLGLIPDDQEEERTLPVFDNHRVAKRYVRRMQRVVKVPDGQVFLKASPYLQAKGITRLLIDGRVYSL
jgi:transposase-like protein